MILKDDKSLMKDNVKGISKITVKGFKSFFKDTSIDIKPITILSGTNNSGKSSIMQPILMMKQTIEEIYDTGSDLTISGNHVQYDTVYDFLSKKFGKQNNAFSIKIEIDGNKKITNTFKKNKNKPIEVVETIYQDENNILILRQKMNEKDILNNNEFYTTVQQSLIKSFKSYVKNDAMSERSKDLTLNDMGVGLCVRKIKCFLSVAIDKLDINNKAIFEPVYLPFFNINIQQILEKHIFDLIHVPADRKDPERLYKIAQVNERYKGPINNYTASIIHNWKETRSPELNKLGKWLHEMGLTWKIDTEKIDEANVKILVHRLPNKVNKIKEDMVNITDVGFGISQVLPVLVSLLVAKRNQLVYIEQPEIHLHPKAQYMIGKFITDAANRGVHVVLETHSEMVLLSIQTMIASQKIPHDKVILHWFSREDDGSTRVTSVQPDKNGSYGEWPVDFAEVNYDANKEFLKASGFNIGD